MLRHIRISILEFANLICIEDMDMTLVTAQGAILSECVNQTIPIDGGCLHTDGHFVEMEFVQRRHDSL